MSAEETAKELFFEGLACLDKNDFAKAEALFVKTLELANGHIATLNNLAVAQYRQRKISEAALTATDILKLDENNSAAHSMLSNCQIEQQDYEAALETCKKAISIDPADAESHRKRGFVLNAIGRYQEASASCDRAIELQPQFAEAFLDRGNSLLHLNCIHEAFAAYDKALSLKPDLLQAWLGRGIALNMLKRHEEAVTAYDKALALDSGLTAAWLGRGDSLSELERYDEAITAYDTALTLNSDLPVAWLGRGDVLAILKRHDQSIAAYETALRLKPDLAAAWLGSGYMYAALSRHDEAFTAYERALALTPDLAEAWVGRAGLLGELGRHDEALAAYHKALILNPDLQAGWLGLGNVLSLLKRHDEALQAYDKILVLKPGSAEAWGCRANAFYLLNRCDDAMAAYDMALSLKPDFAEAWLGRANVLFFFNRNDEAMTAYDEALVLKPDLAEAWLGRGNVLSLNKRFGDAFFAHDKAFSLKPDLTGLEGARLHSKMHLCDWRGFREECQHLIFSIRSGRANTNPFVLLGVPGASDDQMKCAKLWVSKKCPSNAPGRQQDRYDHDRIRVAYLSADFRDHPTSHLTAGLFESHDRKCFEITAISLGPEATGDMQRRLAAAFDRFVDVKAESDSDIARLLRTLEIDIAVDMMGYTASARPVIMANRSAPVQVSYLGYPGTMSADFMDYLIADPTLIPAPHRKNYLEKVAYLPNCYQANDRKREVSARSFARTECGLPERGFVFCCFNNTYKITPEVFDCWMRILNRVQASVLWLLEDSASATENLRREAASRGVDPNRLVFAGRMPLPEHLARHRCADLFLDTLPYNAHTTTSDALWASLPVLTHIGEAFAGRVAASLLNAIGLGELITHSQDEYERMAIDLATDPARLALIKEKLARNRLTTPLFDTLAFTRDIEALYMAMHARFQAGLPPDHIQIPEL